MKRHSKSIRRRIAKQKAIGVFFLAVTAIIAYVAVKSGATGGEDATAMLLTGPLGGYFLFSKRLLID